MDPWLVDVGVVFISRPSNEIKIATDYDRNATGPDLPLELFEKGDRTAMVGRSINTDKFKHCFGSTVEDCGTNEEFTLINASNLQGAVSHAKEEATRVPYCW